MDSYKINVGTFIIFYSEFDYNNRDTRWEKFYNPNHLPEDTYPKYYKYCPPFDAHFVGDYTRITKEEFINYINDEIINLGNNIKKLRKLIT